MDNYQKFQHESEQHKDIESQNIKSKPLVEKKLIEMLYQGFCTEGDSSLYYKRLHNVLISADDKKIVKDIILDIAKHKKCFEELFASFSGTSPAPPNVKHKSGTDSFNFKEKPMPHFFADRLLDELLNVEFYRQIYFALINLEFRDALFEIITDKLRHSQLLNYLYTKYQCQAR